MGKETGILWCDHTFNPWWGCVKVSPACANCYAETWAKRMGFNNLWNGARIMVYPLFMGYPPGNPPFHALEYRGVWREMTAWEQAIWPGDKKKYDEYWKNFYQKSLPMKV